MLPISSLEIRMNEFSLSSVLILNINAGYIIAGERVIENPNWSFQDDFDGAEDTKFWGSEAYITYGASCSSDPDAADISISNINSARAIYLKADKGFLKREMRIKISIGTIHSIYR